MSLFRLLFRALRLLLRLAVLLARVALLCAESVYWIGSFFVGGGQRFVDLVAARKRLSDGQLHCPAGHVVPTEHLLLQCEQCSFTYSTDHGHSIWYCPNRECQAATPFVSCHCGLSIRNPYRYGKPG